VTQFRGSQFTDFIINRGLMPGDSLLNPFEFSLILVGSIAY
jgi:hypothetical protein